MARAGPLAPLTVLPSPSHLAPVVLGRQGRAQSRNLGTSGQASSVAQPEVAFLWSLSPGAWVEEGGCSDGSSTYRQRHPPSRAPQCPRKVRMEAASDTGTLPVRVQESKSPWEALGSRRQWAPSPPTGCRQDNAGLCPCHRRGRGGKLQVVFPCCGVPCGEGCWATQLCRGHRAQPIGPEVASSPGRGGGLLLSPHRKTLGAGDPGGVRAEGDWTVARLVAAGAKASGGWGHRKSQ